MQQALRVLGWQENLTEEEQPPEWMWPLEHELEIWFDEVKRARDEKYGGSGETGDETPSLMTNEFSRQKKE